MAAKAFDFVINIFLLTAYTANSAQITGWVYADNWFELYFNGVKVATDPLTFYPHNAVYIDFTAPDTGLYSFAFKAKDFANDTTGLEPRQGPGGTDVAGWCLGDGGIYIALSDGTVTSSDWKCTVLMEGPTNSACTSITECLDKALQPSICSVTWNSVPSCWNQTICAEADSWSAATEYDGTTVGWGRPPDAEGYGYTYPDICGSNTIYTTEGCKPADKDWGAAKPIWTSDLDFHNRILCRYSYCVDGSSDCTSEGSPSTTENGDTQTDAPTMAPSGVKRVGQCIAVVIGMLHMLI
mmetsp:Transcript_21081/g.33685  ORF Transcript_21081/g.33685 Transcript_21081/m.33685 type:complete len:296 (+) Transcript_21081:58-945(+)